MKKALMTMLFATLAAYGCSSDGGGNATGGTGGGTGGSGGSGGMAGTGGMAGMGGTGGMGGGSAAEYQQDFESLGATDPAALGDDGWLVFGNVFESDGTTFFGSYGPFPAPNSTAPVTPDAFSAIASDEGGPTQGAQQLSIFNDYQNPEHATDRRIESNVFRERELTSDDEGKTLKFSFDAKRGNINDPSGSSTALAFIKTLDQDNEFNLTNFIQVDTTSISTDWMRYELELVIDAGLVGQLVQTGYSCTASMSEPSGVLYDNVLVVVE